MKASAYAKINLALAVYGAAADGFHPLRGLFQSVSLCDTVEIEAADADEVVVSNDEAPADDTNIAWLALDAMRRARRDSAPQRLTLTKRIPAGAGLGGGSADAAAVIGLMAGGGAVDDETVDGIAASLGSDVPFALQGGTALVGGRGEVVTSVEPLTGFAIAVVVPPFRLSTPAVFKQWDRMEEPEGEPMADADLPPVLRGREPMRNDLFPAAVALDPRIGEWRDQLRFLWGTSVAMTGSGSGLFAYFASHSEAVDAIERITLPSRATEAVVCVDRGWTIL
jgi:4-diphosphocytidyl-2-C-methyl-D-erythritol kinase